MSVITTNNCSLLDIANTFGGSLTPPYSLSNYYSELSNKYTLPYRVGVTTIPQSGTTISLGNFLDKQSKPAAITDFSYMSSGTYLINVTANINTTQGWLSGDAISNTYTSESFNYRTAYSSTRRIVQSANIVLRARPGHPITINSRMGQSSSYSSYNCQFWLNTGSGYVLMISNLNISISNGSSSVGTFTIPANTPAGNYTIAATLGKLNMNQLNTTYLTNNYATYYITCDIYALQVYI